MSSSVPLARSTLSLCWEREACVCEWVEREVDSDSKLHALHVNVGYTATDP